MALTTCRAIFTQRRAQISAISTSQIRWASTSKTPQPEQTADPNTHYKITLRRSAISLGKKVKGTLVALGLHRRMQTVFQRHTPEAAGKILRVKELVEVHNVPTHLVRTKEEQTRERRAKRGYKVVGSKRDTFLHVWSVASALYLTVVMIENIFRKSNHEYNFLSRLPRT